MRKSEKAAVTRSGLEIDWRSLPIGRRAHEERGNTYLNQAHFLTSKKARSGHHLK
jgi:hypothetical protein